MSVDKLIDEHMKAMRLYKKTLNEIGVITRNIRYVPIGNCDSMKTAKIVFLGDYHDNQAIMEKHKDVLQDIFRRGDVLLMEGFDYSEVIEPYQYMLTEDLPYHAIVRGWEDISSYREVAGAVQEAKDKFDQALQEKVPMSTRTELVKNASKLLKDNDVRILSERNISLIKNIQNTLQDLPPENKVIVFAGSAHYSGDTAVIEFMHKYSFSGYLSELPDVQEIQKKFKLLMQKIQD